jgi:hypothetical protein
MLELWFRMYIDRSWNSEVVGLPGIDDRLANSYTAASYKVETL